MEKTKPIKAVSGQNDVRAKYDAAFKTLVALQYIGGKSVREVSKMFHVSVSSVSGWVQEYYCELGKPINSAPMTEQENNDVASLKKEIAALKKKLELEQMRNFAWETMAELAKTELGIDIRKNSGAKQPKE